MKNRILLLAADLVAAVAGGVALGEATFLCDTGASPETYWHGVCYFTGPNPGEILAEPYWDLDHSGGLSPGDEIYRRFPTTQAVCPVSR